MNIYTDISEIEKDENTVITMGSFDGVHLGHKSIFEVLIAKSKELNSRNFLVTFSPHPRTVVMQNVTVNLLTTIREKKELFEKAGIENVLIINFTKEFSQLGYEEFIEKYFVNGIGIKHFVVGYDHKFGKDREGNEAVLKRLGNKYGFGVSVVPPLSINNENVSSSKIRKALLNGDLEKATKYLGRNFCFYGKVVEGARRGRLIGFPTANLEINDPHKLVPKSGVYLVNCSFKFEKYYGLMNIGYRPTFGDVTKSIIEVYIIDFDKNIYGENIRIDFIKRIRDEIKFNSKEELIEQISRDKEDTLKFIGELTK